VETSIIHMGLNLMLYGMGMVFVFLTVLIICTSAMSSVIQRYFQEPQLDSSMPSTLNSVSPIDGRTLAILQSAVTKHRNSKK